MGGGRSLRSGRTFARVRYKCTVSEIWRDFLVMACIACTSYPYIESTDSMIMTTGQSIHNSTCRVLPRSPPLVSLLDPLGLLS